MNNAKELYWRSFDEEKPKDQEVILVRGEAIDNDHASEFYVFIYEDDCLCSCTTGRALKVYDRFSNYDFTHWAYIPKPDINPQLKPFDKVLVRDDDTVTWFPNFFARYIPNNNGYPYQTIGGAEWKYCVPYEGNEHLVGTTNKPKEE